MNCTRAMPIAPKMKIFGLRRVYRHQRGRTGFIASSSGGLTNEPYQNLPYNPPNLVSSVVNGPDGPVSYTLGNGLNVYRSYDQLGRPAEEWVCGAVLVVVNILFAAALGIGAGGLACLGFRQSWGGLEWRCWMAY